MSSRRSFGKSPERANAVNNSTGATLADDVDRRRRRNRDIGEYIKEEPLTSLAIASGVGFIVGGGAKSRIGLALLSIVGRIALRGAVTSFVVDLITGNHQDRGAGRGSNRGGSYRNGYNDNHRTDFSDPD
jgi:hypothetical protein